VNKKNLLKKIVQGYKNVRFNEMIKLIEAYSFQLSRVSGSHHIFVKPDIKEIVNIQNVQGKAKPYQVKQFLSLIEQYNLQMEDDN
jgi:predicted RNA binding protein YcfA (HicA-like mRNA interferase family)